MLIERLRLLVLKIFARCCYHHFPPFNNHTKGSCCKSQPNKRAAFLFPQDTADQYLRDRRLTPVLHAVIGGKFAQQIICKGLPYRSEKEEEFYQVTQLSDIQVAILVHCFDEQYLLSVADGL